LISHFKPLSLPYRGEYRGIIVPSAGQGRKGKLIWMKNNPAKQVAILHKMASLDPCAMLQMTSSTQCRDGW